MSGVQRFKIGPLVVALAQSVALTLTPAQRRFLWLHDRTQDPPTKWHWRMGESQLRAYTAAGHTATLSAVEFEQLVTLGLMKRGPGFDAVITAAGRRTC